MRNVKLPGIRLLLLVLPRTETSFYRNRIDFMRSPFVIFMPLVYHVGPYTIILRLVARLFPYLGPEARNVAYPIKDVCTSGTPPHMDFPALIPHYLMTFSRPEAGLILLSQLPQGSKLNASIREFNPAESKIELIQARIYHPLPADFICSSAGRVMTSWGIPTTCSTQRHVSFTLE